jgi:hypothetical protein
MPCYLVFQLITVGQLALLVRSHRSRHAVIVRDFCQRLADGHEWKGRVHQRRPQATTLETPKAWSSGNRQPLHHFE